MPSDKADQVRILAIGDVIGKPGREVLRDRLKDIKEKNKVDFTIVNGENSAGGWSITTDVAQEMFLMGIDVISTGNHVWDNRDILRIINKEPSLLRPANYPNGVDGNGYCVITIKGISICVINLIGRVQMKPVDCPFRKFDLLYPDMQRKSDIIIVDFHAEATSEKEAFGWYVDGRASAVFGTHTHVQTADERILTKGTGYITDLGMTGAFDSVIGMKTDQSIERFLKQVKIKYDVAKENPGINGVIMDINKNGKTEKILRINERQS
ncbi:TIGR00282 family metallophosphoesterase [Spirochaetota bacterium]